MQHHSTPAEKADVFTPGEREQCRERLLAAARSDPDVTGAAHVGSYVAGATDDWSDIDMALAVRGEVHPVVRRWSDFVYSEFQAIHHWDLPVNATMFRVYLLRSGLEIDLAFTPEAEFAPEGPNWRTVFGTEATLEKSPPARVDNLVGLCWHHVIHAAANIERNKLWQSEWLVSQARHHVFELACRRHGVPVDFGKGTDLLPTDVTRPLEATLVARLHRDELWRAVAATADAVVDESQNIDASLAASLRTVFDEVLLRRT